MFDELFSGILQVAAEFLFEATLEITGDFIGDYFSGYLNYIFYGSDNHENVEHYLQATGHLDLNRKKLGE